MHFYALSALALPATVLANYENVVNTLNNIASEQGTRTLADGWAASMIDSIDGYGCWCYFESEHGKGKGQPQNEVDAQCKILHDGYTCVMMDALEDGEECEAPWEMDYHEPTGLGYWSQTGSDDSMKEALRKDCARKNRKGENAYCMQKACMVEGYFAINLFGLMTNGVKYDKNLLHSKGRFDPKLECPVKSGPNDMEKRCCGQYPVRFPYRHADNRRECCGQHTYNAEFLQCCAGDEVKLTCF